MNRISVITLKIFIKGIVPGYDPDNLPTSFLKFNHLSDAEDRTVLMIAAEAGNLVAVKYFIKCGLPVLYRINENYAIDYAYKGRYENIMLELLEANSVFPKNFEPNCDSPDLINFIELMKAMHQSVRRNDKITVSKIINQNSHLKYFFNKK